MELLKVAHVRLHISSGLGWKEADLKIFNTWNAFDILKVLRRKNYQASTKILTLSHKSCNVWGKFWTFDLVIQVNYQFPPNFSLASSRISNVSPKVYLFKLIGSERNTDEQAIYLRNHYMNAKFIKKLLFRYYYIWKVPLAICQILSYIRIFIEIKKLH